MRPASAGSVGRDRGSEGGSPHHRPHLASTPRFRVSAVQGPAGPQATITTGRAGPGGAGRAASDDAAVGGAAAGPSTPPPTATPPHHPFPPAPSPTRPNH